MINNNKEASSALLGTRRNLTSLLEKRIHLRESTAEGVHRFITVRNGSPNLWVISQGLNWRRLNTDSSFPQFRRESVHPLSKVPIHLHPFSSQALEIRQLEAASLSRKKKSWWSPHSSFSDSTFSRFPMNSSTRSFFLLFILSFFPLNEQRWKWCENGWERVKWLWMKWSFNLFN